MKAQELFRRLYRTLTSIVLFLILLNSWSPAFRDVYSRTFYYFNIGVCGVILTLSVAVYCFSMSRKQGELNGNGAWVLFQFYCCFLDLEG